MKLLGSSFVPLQDVPALPFDVSFWETNLPSVGGFLKFMGFTAFISVATAAGLVAYQKGFLNRS